MAPLDCTFRNWQFPGNSTVGILERLRRSTTTPFVTLVLDTLALINSSIPWTFRYNCIRLI